MKTVWKWMGRVSGAMLLMAAFSINAHAERSWYGYTESVASGKGASGWPNTATCQDGNGGMTGAIGGTCHSHYCWAMTLYHYPLPSWTSFDTSSTYWSPAFSEEGRHLHFCHEGNPRGLGIVTGIRVSGDYSDNIQLRCTQPQNVSINECWWSPWVSDGPPFPTASVELQDDVFLSGMSCRGRYCDDVSFFYCRLTPN